MITYCEISNQYNVDNGAIFYGSKMIKKGMILNFPYSIIDLTHTLDEDSPSWDKGCGFVSSLICDYQECSTSVKFRIQHLNMPTGIGTHMDAPAHCIPKALTVDQIPLSQLIAPAIVIDVSKKSNEYYSLTIEDVSDFEKQYGTIPEGAFVLINTGWSHSWNQPERYHNNYRFPSVSKEAAELLISRHIMGIGIDTLSPDRPESDYPVHHLFLSRDKIIVENVANPEQLPMIGSYIMIAPLNIKNATEAPVRLIGLIPRETQ